MHHLPVNWAAIKPGSIVLATEGKGEPWCEAVVQTIKEATVELRWRDYPAQPNFVRHRTHLALLHPGESAAA